MKLHYRGHGQVFPEIELGSPLLSRESHGIRPKQRFHPTLYPAEYLLGEEERLGSQKEAVAKVQDLLPAKESKVFLNAVIGNPFDKAELSS